MSDPVSTDPTQEVQPENTNGPAPKPPSLASLLRRSRFYRAPISTVALGVFLGMLLFWLAIAAIAIAISIMTDGDLQLFPLT